MVAERLRRTAKASSINSSIAKSSTLASMWVDFIARDAASLLVDRFRLEHFFADRLPTLFVELIVEAAVISIVASRSDLLDGDQQNVLVAIRANRFDGLHVPAALALEPQLVSRAAEEMRLAGLDRFAQRIAIHPGHHQNLVRL